ncbi:MAG: filamentous hemagglutinin N-terminal domain-containing protein [Selenomonas sp.]|uniref:two-partner secretion domain-containing protein n=1 Tax=Selenomonas sp. TaxID=2053611 RepID=UPI0025FD717C|nr:filamentous hemagglutinin N-terminal domain-containing protein [Selenomonas sp.]MCR5438401.1 filamentous hemagglutinin N-terminal domain-containing protein [Selenomonas sp.]
MRGDKEMRQIALRVSIALAAGMFSIVPVVHGAPVGGVVKHGDVDIKTYDTTTKTLNIKDNASGINHNNVIDWQDFSVASGETVKFDDGAKTNNYMNIVSGKNTSDINGAIVGGKDVYIINPNGVIFGEGASVDVGRLYASTRYVSVDDAVAAATAGDMTSVLENTTAGVATDIVNMGSISADKVVLEGQNIRLINSDDISAETTNVTLKAGAGGYIHVGNSTGADAGYATAALVKGSSAAEVDYFTTLTPTDEEKVAALAAGSGSGGFWARVKTTISEAPAKNYMLVADIDASDSVGGITGTDKTTGAFSGKIDGNFHKISNIISAPGLFQEISGTAEIYNIGVADSTFTAVKSDATDGFAGGIAALAGNGAKLDNVYNEKSTVTGRNTAHSGGLIGEAKGVTITNSYNTGVVYANSDDSTVGTGGGLIGTTAENYVDSTTGETVVTGVNRVKDSYSSVMSGGVVAQTMNAGKLHMSRVYGVGKDVVGSGSITADDVENVLIKTASKYKYYSADGSGHETTGVDMTSIEAFLTDGGMVSWDGYISNTGGVTTSTVTIDGVNYGKVTRPAWRIYEGQDMPLLTSHLKGIKTTTYNYEYFTSVGKLDTAAMKYNDGTNGGTDMPAYTAMETVTVGTEETEVPDGLLYNGEYLKIVNSDKTAAAVDENNALKDAKVAFATVGDTTIDNTHVFYNAETEDDTTVNGRKGATYKRATDKQYDLALLYSDQDGYDLYGNNISIAPRTIKVNTEALEDSYVVKEYDGTADVDSDVLKSLFSGDSSSSTGILDADKSKVGLTFTGDSQFQDKDHPEYVETAADSTVGVDKNVPFDGNITLVYEGGDYKLDGATSGDAIHFEGTLKGVITPKQIEVALSSPAAAYTKTYDGDAIVKNADGTDRAVTSADFSAITSYLVGSDAVTLGYDSKAYYVKEATETADTDSYVGDYTGKVRFGGLVLNGDDDVKKNYVLVDKNDTSNVLYSSGKIIYKDTDGVWKEGEAKTTGGALFSTGASAITRRVITSNGFSWYNDDTKKDAVREYNGGYTFTADADGITIAGKYVSNKDAVSGTDYTGSITKMLDDGVQFVVQEAEFITSLSDASAGNAWNVDGEGVSNGAKGIRYTIKVEGAAASNYSLDTLDNELSDGLEGLTVIGRGEITPRTINLILKDTADKSKKYDGDADVKRGSGTSATKEFYFYADPDKSSLNTDFIIYADDDVDHHFLSTDTTAKIKLTGAYQAMPAIDTADVTAPAVEGKDVYYDTKNDEVLAKDIIFTAKVMDGDNVSKNYKIATGTFGEDGETVVAETTDTDGKTVFSLTGKDAVGKINQREISSLTFASVSKTYDGSDAVTNSKSADTATFKTDDVITINGAVLSDGLTFADTGDSVDTVFNDVGTGASALITGQYGAGTTLAAWEPDENAGAKDVKYTLSDGLLKNHNYKMDITEVIDAGGGEIEKLTIKESEVKVKRNSSPITKVYNGDEYVAHDDVTAESYLDSVYVDKDTSSGTLAIGFTVTNAVYDDEHSHDSGEQGVTYTLTLADTTNIKVTTDSGTDLYGVVTKTTDDTGAGLTGVITPRGIVVGEGDIVSSVTKIYDGGLTVKIGEAAASGEALVSGINEQILEADYADGAGIANNSDAVYSNKNVNAIDTDLDADTGLKKVTYNLKLAGDTYHDYKFVNASGDELTTLYKGNGKVTPRSLTVSTTAMDADTGWPVKTYGTYDDDWADEDTKVASVKRSTMPTGAKLDFGSAENNAVVDTDVDLDEFAGALKGLYGERSTDDTFVINGDVNTSGKDVQYSGVIAALGDNAGNYTVEDTFYGRGKINPLALTRDRINIAIGTATKTYDNTYTVKKDGEATTRDKNYITTFQVQTADGDWEDFGYSYDSALYKDDRTITATTVMYKLGLGDIETNYIIDDSLYEEDLVNGYINGSEWWQEAAGTITKATVYASLKDEPGTDTVVKPYDGDDAVTTAGVADKVQVRGLFDDGTSFTPSNIHYADANVGRDADGNVAAKDVYYDVTLTGDFKDNYILAADTEATYTADTDINGTLTGKGMITPLSITASFAPAVKPYDPDSETTATVRDTDKVITFSGATGAGAIELDSTALHKIIGTYGIHDSTKDAFTADGHVYRPSADTDEVGTKPVLYENIAAAYHDYIARNMDSAARNYEVADEPVFYGTEHGDKITPLSLDTVKAQWTSVDKTYDTTPDVKDPKGVLKLVATSSTDGATKNLDYTYSTAQYNDDAGNPVSVVGTYTLNYNITKVKTNQGDYQLSTEAAAGATRNWLSTDATNNVGGAEVKGKINRRVLTVDTDGAYFRKIYDGDTFIDDATTKEQLKFAFSDEDESVWATDFGDGNVDYSVTATFVGAEASAMPGEILNGKDVKYTLKLTGDKKNNYTLTEATKDADTTAVHEQSETLVKKGDIEKRELKVQVKSGYGSVAARDYNGSDVVDGFGGTSWFEFEDADATTGVVGSEAVKMKESVKAAYAHDGDVNRGNYSGKGKVEDAIVNFTNFELDDSPANKNYYISTETLQGSGRINPLTITVDVKEAPTKEYDGKTDVGKDNWMMASDDYPDYSKVIDADKDNVKAFIQSADFKNPNASTGDKAYTYNLAMENGNNYQLVLADDSKHTAESTDDGLTLAVSGKDGTIKPRRLTASVIREMTKEYDGDTSGTKNAEANISFGDRVVSGDNIGLTAQATYDNPNAGISEGSSELRKHDVIYTLNLSNPNYELAADKVTGSGTISRKGLNIVATPANVNTGEAMPEFTGTVEGLLTRDLGLASSFKFDTLPTTSTSVIGSYPVYGWYSNRTSGNFGLNYTFDQDASNATAFTVTPSSIINDNPDSKITPNGDIYNQISKDLNSGFGDNGAAAIEYVDKSGNVIARENIDSGEIHGSGFDGGVAATELGKGDKSLATIGIVGGDIVNLDGADAASTANIELDGNGSIVNLEVFSITGEQQKADDNSGAEIVSTDSEGNLTMEIQNTGSVSNATIQLVDESGNVLEENNEDKAENQKKEGEIAIESSNNQNDDEIELKVEDEGVNVA